MQQQKLHSQTNSHQLNWCDIRFENIIGGKTADGVSYLDLFLQDFTKVFNVKNPNKNCSICIREYHKRYIQKLTTMATDCNYTLHKKYNGLPLEVSGKNSSVSVTNSNLTNEYAKILLRRFKEPATIFSKFPKEEVKEVSEEVVQPKKRRKRNK